MAGVGEASAIVNLIAIAPQLSKAVIQAASNYNQAKPQIESFGREVCMLGEILGQLRDVLFPDNNKSNLEPGVKSLLSQILDECSGMFSQLNGFNDRLHAKPNALQGVNRRGSSDTKADENAKNIMELSQKNEACIKRLQMLENEGAPVEEHVHGKISSSMSVMSAETVGTAGSVQSNSTWNSIFRAYGWEVQKDEGAPPEDAESDWSTDEEPVLWETIRSELPLDAIQKYDKLEELGLIPSILDRLDGDRKPPAWKSPRGAWTPLDYELRRLKEANAPIAQIKEPKKEK